MWALWVTLACWAVFSLRIAANHVRVRRRRGAEHGPDLRAPVSMAGLLLEGVAIFMVFFAPRPLREINAVESAAAAGIAIAGVALAWAALSHLGMQWRVKAVVTPDHELITTGPYGFVRHPIYLSLLCLTLASGLLLTPRPRLLAAMAIYLAGTEIRVRAEDGILRRRFGAAFEEYRSRVGAYFPRLARLAVWT